MTHTRHKPKQKRKVEMIMKTGKITAKLRDAVPVCLMVNGEEVKRYKNIELPDALKEVEMTDFHFNVHMDGKITFEIHYEEGALPEIFPEARTRVSRAAKAAAKAAAQESTEVMAVEAAEPEIETALQESPRRSGAFSFYSAAMKPCSFRLSMRAGFSGPVKVPSLSML